MACTRWSIPRPNTPRSSAKSGAVIAIISTCTNMHGYDWNALRAKYEPMLA